MIIKVGARGTDPGGFLRYCADTQTQRNVHTDPTLVASSLGYTGPLDPETLEAAIGDLRTPYLLNPDVQIPGGHIWHAALVLHPEEAPLPQEVWKNVSEDFLKKMGIEDPGKYPARWASVNHGLNSAGADHVHVVANLVRENGHRIKTWRDYPRAMAAATELESEYGLKPNPDRNRHTSPRGPSRKDVSRSKTNQAPETRHAELERRVRAAAAGATNQEEFVENLSKDGIRFRPSRHKDKNGKDTGYSINLPGTTTQGGREHWWAGGKLARDLSLPRLQLRWETPVFAAPTHVSAMEELKDLQKRIPGAQGEELADIAHQLAGALAAASQATETTPGPLAASSKQVGTIAQTKTYTWKPKPPSLGVGMLFLQALDPTGPVGQAVMIRQLLAASKALTELHLARKALPVTPSGRNTMTQAPDDELLQTAVTAGATGIALYLERRANQKIANLQPSPPPMSQKDRNRELWDRNTIRRDRQIADAKQGQEQRQTPEQREKISALAEEFELPLLDINSTSLNQQEADDLIEALETTRTPGEMEVLEQIAAFENQQSAAQTNGSEPKEQENVFGKEEAASIYLAPEKSFDPQAQSSTHLTPNKNGPTFPGPQRGPSRGK